MCKVCENEQCLECEPYFYKQVILQPERESPVPFNPGNETSSTTVSTSTTVATTPTPTTTTTTEPGVTTEIPTFVKCVSQCDPGEAKMMLATVLHLIENISHVKIIYCAVADPWFPRGEFYPKIAWKWRNFGPTGTRVPRAPRSVAALKVQTIHKDCLRQVDDVTKLELVSRPFCLSVTLN